VAAPIRGPTGARDAADGYRTGRHRECRHARVGKRATLKLFEDADHSFHVPAPTGRKDADVRAEMLDALAAWIDAVMRKP
jgi:hypothetical protein